MDRVVCVYCVCVCVCVTCVMDFLCDVDSLSVGQAPVHRRARSWSQGGVERVNVEAQVDGPLLPVRELWDILGQSTQPTVMLSTANIS